MNDISILLAFSAGLLSFLSPCVLPLVPAYISYLTGSSIEELKDGKAKLSVLYKSFGFVLGFSIIFILMGVSITSLGKLLITHKNLFRKVGGTIIVVFGLHTIGLFKIKLFYREKRFLYFDKIKGPFSSVIMGMAFATGWTPCIGPILSSILIYATSMNSIGKGVLLLIMYSLGLAVPFILTAMAIGSFTKQFRKFSIYLPIISIISGVLMIIMGVMIFTNKLAILSQYMNFINF
ncbi:cytochrome c biogenesis protein CcdA [Clostridium sp. CM028]|uniref:cytochrome c biogenesis CcdA family protein n=1 Tax=unclassified Clostridium TaxID=2614128 RepID=UPI001C6F448A|nr:MULTISPECIES: cytochrome c biogenesis protein CcdA [unclassified Clostridium]MBW9145933.1 cytochrome c biogenesis protein CcdA [Clostridium sp. CM027]MBW9149620.1 cytochrome c biogenesis protein CcdA [Clostridium sp. CM028]UVE40909.1 cytochrome c biogenesis protein CcdA [Clostridium sp. CM027]WLC61576.1 cytochrome c biogenesis protein CcdA [Clostridium sp. CM028]